jgi:hypothetical protein
MVRSQGNARVRTVLNIVPYSNKCNFFSNIFYVWELAYTRLLSFFLNSLYPSSVNDSFYGLISHSHLIIHRTFTTDGGKLPDRVSGLRFR